MGLWADSCVMIMSEKWLKENIQGTVTELVFSESRSLLHTRLRQWWQDNEGRVCVRKQQLLSWRDTVLQTCCSSALTRQCFYCGTGLQSVLPKFYKSIQIEMRARHWTGWTQTFHSFVSSQPRTSDDPTTWPCFMTWTRRAKKLHENCSGTQ